MKTLAAVYASEGTGHKSAAAALCEAFLASTPGGRALCVDVLDFVPPFLKNSLSCGYDAMARRAPWLWSRLYWGSDHDGIQAAAFELIHRKLCRVYLPKLHNYLAANGAEAVIFTHYFGAAEYAAMYPATPVYFADTDFATHKFQRRGEFAQIFAGSPRAAQERVACGIAGVRVTGVPVAQKYSRLPSKGEARERLGISRSAEVVLVSGGGIGSGPIEQAAASLAASNFTVLAVCGKNEKLLARMKSYFMYKENLRVVGFVQDMENYYAAADVAVMKPGGLSASEALCAGLPMLLTDPIPGQEELNLAYLSANGAAQRLPLPRKAAEAASRVLIGGDADKMREKALAIARPNAAEEIIRAVTEDASTL